MNGIVASLLLHISEKSSHTYWTDTSQTHGLQAM